MLKKGIVLILALALCLALLPARGENVSILGQPFPDFTATDTEGSTFTLSEALKEKKLVLINLWATWCPPCQAEFPFLNEAYLQRADDVAVIALSIEPDDTLDIIAQYKKQLDLSLPMGRDEDLALAGYVDLYYIPTTVIVDRFGNACFMDSGMFTSAEEILALMDGFLGDDYTASRVIEPPVPATWDVGCTGGARQISLTYFGEDIADSAWITESGEADFVFRLADGEVNGDYLMDETGWGIDFADLYDPLDGAYHYHAEIMDGEMYSVLFALTARGDSTLVLVLSRGEDGLQSIADDYFDGEALDWAYMD